jgi:hypothetical protein
MHPHRQRAHTLYIQRRAFDHFPPKMLTKMAFLNVFWLNTFPNKLGVSQTLSPRSIVTGLGIYYTKHCRIEYGQYVQTHEKHDNSMATRTVGALALRPTGNQQGGHYFYSLMTGMRLHRTHWTEVPMPAKVKERVHALARRANANRDLVFTNSDNNDLDTLFPDDDNVSDYNPDDNDALSYASSKDSNYNPDNPDDSSSDGSNSNTSNHIPDLSAALPRELAGVDDKPVDNIGVENIPVNNTGVENILVDNTGVDETPTDLKRFVNELKSALDSKIADFQQIQNRPRIHNQTDRWNRSRGHLQRCN